MSRDVIQVRLPGFIGLVHREDVVRDEDGNIIVIRPRGHGNGSEGEGTEGLSSAEKQPSGV
jgi:hypothetical protein